MSTAAAAVVEFSPHYLQSFFVLMREHGLVAQTIAGATAAAATFPDVGTLRAYRL